MQTEHLMVAGMTCGGCTSKVSRALRFLESMTSIDQLKSTVKNAGYGVDEPLQSNSGCCDSVKPLLTLRHETPFVGLTCQVAGKRKRYECKHR